MIKLVLFFAFVYFIMIQAIHVDIPVDLEKKRDYKAPEHIIKILKDACYDCHSYETKWPWYSYMAPVSWLIRYDVDHALKWLNYNRWDEYKDKTKEKLLRATIRLIDSGGMPTPIYLFMHDEAQLTKEQKEQVKIWAKNSLINKDY